MMQKVILYSAMLQNQMWLLVPIWQYQFERRQQVLACLMIPLLSCWIKKYRFQHLHGLILNAHHTFKYLNLKCFKTPWPIAKKLSFLVIKQLSQLSRFLIPELKRRRQMFSIRWQLYLMINNSYFSKALLLEYDVCVCDKVRLHKTY